MVVGVTFTPKSSLDLNPKGILCSRRSVSCGSVFEVAAAAAHVVLHFAGAVARGLAGIDLIEGDAGDVGPGVRQLPDGELNQLARRAAPLDDHDALAGLFRDRKSTRLNSSHSQISYAVFCLK